MIVWLSGPYGVGKSTLAEALAAKLDRAILFDAEEVGNAVRENYPNQPYGVVYEDYPLWHEFCVQLLKDLHTSFAKTILVPMTLVRPASYESLICRLQAEGIPTELIVLEASWQTVHDRILARGEEEGCWCMENIEMARSGSASLPGGHRINTDGKTVDELAAEVLALLGW